MGPEPSEGGPDRARLTDDQLTLLLSAAREGYFKVPREVTMADLAAQHELSSREASERVRRGLDVLVRDTLNVD